MMPFRNSIVFAALLIKVLFAQPNASSDTVNHSDESYTSDRHIFSSFNLIGNVNIDYLFESNEINSLAPQNNVTYNSEGLSKIGGVGNIGFFNLPMVTFHYDRTLKNSASQKEMLTINKTKVEGIEKFTAGIKLDPITAFIFRKNNAVCQVLRNITSVRFKYATQLYFNDASIIKSSYYFPRNSFINYSNTGGVTLTGAQLLERGDNIGFKTNYVYNEISIPLATVDIPIKITGNIINEFKIGKSYLRCGYYDLTFNRISSKDNLTINEIPLVYEAQYQSEGIVLSYETIDVGSPGLNVDCAMKIKLNDNVSSAIDWKKFYDKNRTFESEHKYIDYWSGGFNINMWYNWYIGGNKNKGFFSAIGFNYSAFLFDIDIKQTVKNSDGSETVNVVSKIAHDSDLIGNFFLTLAYRF